MNTTPDPSRSTNRRFRRATAIGLTAGLLGGGAAGLMLGVPSLTSASSAVVTQQTDTGTDTATDASADASTDTATERGERLRELLQSLVDDGTLTAAQADAVTAHLVENMPSRGPGRGHHGGGKVAAETIAGALGVTTDELRDALRDGQSIADIAAAEGVDLQVVIDAMLTEIEERLDAKVADGTITQEDADARLAEATERITDRVNEGGGFGRMGRGGPADAPLGDATDA